ncbi:MAG: hypothetical protein OMM_10936, partial [Candidatus Magnetoglobus multicellularis str. Araruama]
MNTININGNDYRFTNGQTILDVANENNIDIPTLCYLKGASPTGACRMCVVEVQGARNLMTSCSTPAAKNMVVLTESPAVVRSRKMTLELLLSSGNHNCAIGTAQEADWTNVQLNTQANDDTGKLCPVWGIADYRIMPIVIRWK